MNIFSISNLISIKVQNYSGTALSLNNRLIPSPGEVDIASLGFSVASFQEYITAEKPGLYALLSNPNSRLKLIPVTASDLRNASAPVTPKAEVKKVEVKTSEPVVPPAPVKVEDSIPPATDVVSFISSEAELAEDGEFNPFSGGEAPAEEVVEEPTMEEESATEDDTEVDDFEGVGEPTEPVKADASAEPSKKSSKKKKKN